MKTLNNEAENAPQYPELRWLDSVYVEVERAGSVVTRCFTDLTAEEQERYLTTLSPDEVAQLCMHMASAVRGIGDIYGLSFVGIEE